MTAIKDIFAHLHLHKNQLIEARFQNSATAPTEPQEGQPYYNTTAKKFYGWNGTEWVDLSQIVTGGTVMRGEISNADTNPPFASNPSTGDSYFVTGVPGTVGGLPVEGGDQLVRSTSGWFVVQRNLQASTQAIAGFMRLATQLEVNQGGLANVAVSPATLAQFLVGMLYARKFVVVLPSLTAGTPTNITHGLNLLGAEHVTPTFWQAGVIITLACRASSVNAVVIETNQTLGNVTVVLQG